MNTSTRSALALFLAQLSILILSSKAISQNTYKSDTLSQGRQSLVEKYKDHLVPENIVFQAVDGSARHYRINETTVLAIINASASGRLYRASSSDPDPDPHTGFLKVQAGATGCPNYHGWRSWAKYPLSSLSCVQSINDVDQNIYCFNEYHVGLNVLEFDTRRVTVDPVTANALTLWNAIGSGTQYDNEENADGPTGGTCSNATQNAYDMSADQDLLNAITSPGWFALGYLVCNDDNPSYYADFCGATDLNPPNLAIAYTPRSAPSTPSLSSPANGATCVSLTVTFDWSDVTNAESYRFQVDDDPGFGSPAIDRPNLTSSQYTAQPGELSSNTPYYWHIRASNCTGNSPYSPYRSFTTSPPTPSSPSLVSPPNGVTCIYLPITLDWNPVSDAVQYHLQVDDNSNFSSPEINPRDITSSEYTIRSGLSSGVTYYWRVRGINSCDVGGNFSSIRNFTTAPPPLTSPALISPSNGADSRLPVTFSWGSVSYASSYRLLVSDLDTVVTNTNCTITSGRLPVGTTYWWVQARNSCENGPWSEMRTLNIITSVEEIENVIPQSYSLQQNYPNPFNPITTIEFSIPKQSFVLLTIFNSLGMEIEVLVHEQLPPGNYRAQWSRQDAPTGVYFYQLRSQEFTDTKKLLLLR